MATKLEVGVAGVKWSQSTVISLTVKVLDRIAVLGVLSDGASAPELSEARTVARVCSQRQTRERMTVALGPADCGLTRSIRLTTAV